VQIRGGPAAVIGDGEGGGASPATVRAHPDGKAAPHRLNRKPEDLPGGSRITPDGKGSFIFAVELPFLLGATAFGPDFQALSPDDKEHVEMDRKNQKQQSAAASPAPISIRYVCDANGEQVGLSHYLMTEGRKAR